MLREAQSATLPVLPKAQSQYQLINPSRPQCGPRRCVDASINCENCKIASRTNIARIESQTDSAQRIPRSAALRNTRATAAPFAPLRTTGRTAARRGDSAPKEPARAAGRAAAARARRRMRRARQGRLTVASNALDRQQRFRSLSKLPTAPKDSNRFQGLRSRPVAFSRVKSPQSLPNIPLAPIASRALNPFAVPRSDPPPSPARPRRGSRRHGWPAATPRGGCAAGGFRRLLRGATAERVGPVEDTSMQRTKIQGRNTAF